MLASIISNCTNVKTNFPCHTARSPTFKQLFPLPSSSTFLNEPKVKKWRRKGKERTRVKASHLWSILLFLSTRTYTYTWVFPGWPLSMKNTPERQSRTTHFLLFLSLRNPSPSFFTPFSCEATKTLLFPWTRKCTRRDPLLPPANSVGNKKWKGSPRDSHLFSIRVYIKNVAVGSGNSNCSRTL